MIIKYEIDHRSYDNTLQVEYDEDQDNDHLVIIRFLKVDNDNRVFFTKAQCIKLRNVLDMLIKK